MKENLESFTQRENYNPFEMELVNYVCVYGCACYSHVVDSFLLTNFRKISTKIRKVLSYHLAHNEQNLNITVTFI